MDFDDMTRPMHPIYNIPFGLVCLSTLFFSASFNMLIPELPSYLSSLGGGAYKGLIIALFTLTAGLSRPFSGKLADTLGRVPVMAVGSLVCFVCGFLYPLLGTVSGFLSLRLLHGFSTGFKPTATAAYVADLVPKERWGEALGFHSLCFSIGLAIGPAIGSTIRLYYSLNTLFYASSLLALLSIVILINMKETLKVKQPFRLPLLRISRQDLIAFEVFSPALITFLSYIAFGAILTLIPDWSEHFGIINKGVFFMVLTLASALIRLFAGKVSDQYGRIPIINIGLVLLVVSLVMIGYADTYFSLIAGSGMYGAAIGVLSPALNAWTVDMSHPDHRGKALATMYIAMEAGVGLGALFSGWFYQDRITQVPMILYATAVIAGLGLVYMALLRKSKHSQLAADSTSGAGNVELKSSL